MRAALVVAGSELRRFSRDRTALFFVLALPLAVMVVIGSTFGAAPTSFVIGIVAEPGAGTTMVDALDDADFIETRRFDERRDLDVGIRTGALAGGVVIEPGSTTIVLDPTESYAAEVRSVLAGVLVPTRTIEVVAERTGADIAEVRRAAIDFPATEVSRVAVDASAVDGEFSASYTAPSNLVLFTFVNSLVAGGVLVAARRDGITQRWAAAPVRVASLVGGVLISRMVFAVIQALIIVVAGAAMYSVPWGDPLGVAAVILVFGAIASGTGVLVGTLATNEEQTTAVGIPLSIAMAMLGGCMWPLEVVGDTMAAVGHITPHAWAMDAFVTLIYDGGGLGDILGPLTVLAGFAAVIVAASVALLSRRLV